MDEIMELLSDEIDGFNRSIKKLEVLSKKWDELKIKADTSTIEFHIKENLRKSEQSMDRYSYKVREIQEDIKKAQFMDILVMLTPHSGHVDPSVDFGQKDNFMTILQFFSKTFSL